MQFLAQQLFWGAVLPATITFLLLAISWQAWRREGALVHWATPLALAAGYLFAHWRILGLPLRWPPVDSNEWLFVVAVAAGLWGVAEQALSRQPLWRDAGRALLVLVISWLVLRPLMGNVWQGNAASVWWLSLAAGWWLWWSLQQRLAERAPGLPVPLVLSMVAGGGGFVLLWSNSSSLSQLSGAVAAVTGALVPLVWWRRGGSLGAGGVAWTAGVLGLLWVNAVAFVPVPLWRIIALMLASITPALALLPVWRQRPVWGALFACAAVTALILAVVMLPTYRAYVASAAAYGY